MEKNLADKIREIKSLIEKEYPQNYQEKFWVFGAAISSDLAKGKSVKVVFETLKTWA